MVIPVIIKQGSEGMNLTIYPGFLSGMSKNVTNSISTGKGLTSLKNGRAYDEYLDNADVNVL